MKLEKIKPIPKNIIAEIKKRETKIDGYTRYYAYLTTNDREIVKVTVAVKYKGKTMYYKQCAVHGLNSTECFVKDMCYTQMGGYQVGWWAEGLYKTPKWYEDGEWGTSDDKYFNVFAPILNIDFLARYDKYKYSAYDIYTGCDILQYLRLYEEYPQVEYLVKFGLSSYVKNKQLLKKISKNKSFQKWLFKNHTAIQGHFYYVSTILKAYEENKPLEVIQAYEEKVKKINADKSLKPIRELFGKDIYKYIDYTGKQKISNALYLDYLIACNYLGLDMSQEKNSMPHDFKYWHDVRIDEYNTAKAIKDAEEKKALYDNFSKVAEKYSKLCNDNGAYMVVIAKSPEELINEGKVLNHCVGRMNYDQKFIREESLIFFVRTKENPTEPFVTVEYSIKSKKVLQCYAKGNSTPDADVKNYIDSVWIPYANKLLKQNAA